MKNSNKKKKQPSNTPAQFCQERLACSTDCDLPSVKCIECGTLQCDQCNIELHREGEYVDHNRILLGSDRKADSRTLHTESCRDICSKQASTEQYTDTCTVPVIETIAHEVRNTVTSLKVPKKVTDTHIGSQTASFTDSVDFRIDTNSFNNHRVGTQENVRSLTRETKSRSSDSNQRLTSASSVEVVYDTNTSDKTKSKSDLDAITTISTSTIDNFHSLSLDSILSSEFNSVEMRGSSKKVKRKANSTTLKQTITSDDKDSCQVSSELDELNVDTDVEYFSTVTSGGTTLTSSTSTSHTGRSISNCTDEEVITDLMQSISEGNLQSVDDISNDGTKISKHRNPPPTDIKSVSQEEQTDSSRSFLFIDENERIQTQSEEDWLRNLGCDRRHNVKVVSIFGNTGDGKSYTMNQVFFNGRQVFATSADQETCTVGVWAAYDPHLKVVCIDTEGLLGVTSNQLKRMRLLLKVLAVSDVVIYRTCADRLHTDLFQFLGDASIAYTKHFKKELEVFTAKNGSIGYKIQDLGPCVIVFHETYRTNTLNNSANGRPAAEILRQRSAELGCDLSAFSALHYVGTKTTNPPTDFQGIFRKIRDVVSNCSVRSPRSPHHILEMLKTLNIKFNGELYSSSPNTFPDEFFTCTAQCLACHTRCQLSMNHIDNHICSSSNCRYVHVYDNKVYVCKHCYLKGVRNVVVPKTCASNDSSLMGVAKYAWAGYVLECRDCGIIYRSRQHWYGNADPTQQQVQCEVQHIWPGQAAMPTGTHNAARKLLDGVKVVADTVGNYGSKPARLLSDWVADQVAPPYWVPNNKILNCSSCGKLFGDHEKKHHCRACGEGFCDECTPYTKRVPERGWGPNPVRVCESCYNKADVSTNISTESSDTNTLLPRQVAENVQTVLGAVASVAIEYPIEMIKDSARPAYWIPDHLIKACHLCQKEFGPKLPLHHCRACGNGVCHDCSNRRRCVPSRGWDTPVRVCITCYQKTGDL